MKLSIFLRDPSWLVILCFRRFLQIFQYLLGMPVRLHFLKDVLDLPVWPDNERSPGNPHDLLAVHVLFHQDPVGNGHFLVGIGQQGEGKFLLIDEFFLRGRGIWRYPKQHGARLLNLFI